MTDDPDVPDQPEEPRSIRFFARVDETFDPASIVSMIRDLQAIEEADELTVEGFVEPGGPVERTPS